MEVDRSMVLWWRHPRRQTESKWISFLDPFLLFGDNKLRHPQLERSNQIQFVEWLQTKRSDDTRIERKQTRPQARRSLQRSLMRWVNFVCFFGRLSKTCLCVRSKWRERKSNEKFPFRSHLVPHILMATIDFSSSEARRNALTSRSSLCRFVVRSTQVNVVAIVNNQSEFQRNKSFVAAQCEMRQKKNEKNSNRMRAFDC